MPPQTSIVNASPTSAFTPAIPPPSGVLSNPDHPASLAHYSHLTTGICVPVITLFFVLRTYVRVFIKRTWAFEDGKNAPSIFKEHILTSYLVLTTTAWVNYTHIFHMEP
jgi:hypothetical protein